MLCWDLTADFGRGELAVAFYQHHDWRNRRNCCLYALCKYQMGAYDLRLYCLLLSILFSLSSLFGFDMQIIVPLSYLCFGVMRLFSCLTAIPLTAHYSKVDYKGDDALKNPLFLKTNRILPRLQGGRAKRSAITPR